MFTDLSGKICKLEISHPFDCRCSTFFTTTPPQSMAKLTFLPYGYDVHKALYDEDFAPALLGSSCKPEIGAVVVVMEYLAPPTDTVPGWITLFDLFQQRPALVHEKKESIRAKLDEIVLILKHSKFVHGDLRSNNLMICCTFDTIMDPVRVKAIDMEWAGKLGEACYPDDRNEEVGYPGKAASPIGSGDDAYMVNLWWDGLHDA